MATPAIPRRVSVAILLLGAGALVLPVAHFACDRGGEAEEDGEMLEDDDVGDSAFVAPPVEFTDADLSRVMSVLITLRPQLETRLFQLYPDASKRPPLKIGPDTASYLGADALPALRKEGFISAAQFDALLGNVLVAWQRVQLGETGGFDVGERVFNLKSARQAKETEKKQIADDPNLSPDDKKKRQREIDDQIAEIDDQLAEISDRSLALKRRFDSVPQQNLEAVTKRKVELARLFAPR